MTQVDMDDGSDDSSSSPSSPSRHVPHYSETEAVALPAGKEIVEDLTGGENDDIDSDVVVSLPSFSSKNGAPPVVIPRAYQLEMLEESLQRNIIVTMVSIPKETTNLVKDAL